jgi:hypothetical protein
VLSIAFCCALLHFYALALYLALLLVLSLGGLARAITRFKVPFCATARLYGLRLLSLPLRSMVVITCE